MYWSTSFFFKLKASLTIVTQAYYKEDYIATFEDATLAHEYESVKEMAKKCGTKAYPLTKKWFLGRFSKMEGGFDMDAARKDIANFRIAQATKPLTDVSSDNAEQTDEAA